MNKKKVLIFYAAIGLGHKSIAENIGVFLESQGYEVVLHDAQKVQGGFLAVEGKKLYEYLLAKIPFVWDWLYNTSWFITATLPFRTFVAGFNYKNLLNKINEIQPDVIISAHTTSSAVVSYLKQKELYTGKFGIAFSDFHLHRYWLYDNADFYLANIVEQKQGMIALGVRAEKIFVCGMALNPAEHQDVEQIKQKFGIKPNEKIALVASGSQGTDIDTKLIEGLIDYPNIRAIVVCGKNTKLFEQLSLKYKNTKAIVLGFHKPMDELYAVADLFISKPGGLSMAEALSHSLPMLISHLLPGQEKHNYAYLLKKGLVLPMHGDVLKTAIEELDAGKFKQELINNANLSKLSMDKVELLKAVS